MNNEPLSGATLNIVQPEKMDKERKEQKVKGRQTDVGIDERNKGMKKD
jgi:hypothetical protein